jgi:phenylalanyl-tRNA synthetase beta chain
VSPVSTFPSAKEDFAFVVDATIPAESVVETVRDAAGEVVEEARLFDVYTGEQVAEGKASYAVAVRLRAADRTLSAEDIAGAREQIVSAVTAAHGASLRA